MPIEAQGPPESRRPGVVRLGIGNHPRLVSDSHRFHYGCERLRRQEQIPDATLICPTQIAVPIEMHGPWQMPTLVEGSTRTIAAPARIHYAQVVI
jgi:hypothetical protein